MRAVVAAVLTLASLVQTGRVASGQDTFSVEGLRCEYLSNPLGIDVEKPRLSWRLTPGPRGRQQSAYQVLVASSPAILQRTRATSGIPARPAPARPPLSRTPDGRSPRGTAAWWKVRAWDQAGRVDLVERAGSLVDGSA